jgi:hypothetical protein
MSIEGNISVNVLFHDTDGTTSLKVVSLETSTAYTTGKVAVETGTVGTTGITINSDPTSYKDAAGNVVSIGTIQRLAFCAHPFAAICDDLGRIMLASSNRQVAVSNAAGVTFNLIKTTAGTASYTLVLYGT